MQISYKIYPGVYSVVPIVYFFFLKCIIRCSIETGIKLKNIQNELESLSDIALISAAFLMVSTPEKLLQDYQTIAGL